MYVEDLRLVVCFKRVPRLQYYLNSTKLPFFMETENLSNDPQKEKKKKVEKAKITPREVLTNIEWHLPGIWIKTKGRVGFLLGDIYTWAQSGPCVKTDRRRVDIPSAAALEVFQPFSVFSMRCKTAFVCCCWFVLGLFAAVRYVSWQVNVSVWKQIKDPNADFARAASVFNRFYLFFISEPTEGAENGKMSPPICVLTATHCCFSDRARVFGFFLFQVASCALQGQRNHWEFGKTILLNLPHPQWFVQKPLVYTWPRSIHLISHISARLRTFASTTVCIRREADKRKRRVGKLAQVIPESCWLGLKLPYRVFIRMKAQGHFPIRRD